MKAWACIVACALMACTQRPAAHEALEGWSRRGEHQAEHFQVWSRGEERLVIVLGAAGAQDTAGRYQLAPDGRFTDLPWRTVRLRTPVRVALTSTTHAPFLSALGRGDAVVACAHLDQVRDTAVLARIRAGAVREIGTGDGIDREQLLALHADAIFGYPFGRDDRMLERSGAPMVEVCEYLEEHPLGRAEWVRFFGTLFHEEGRADSLFARIADRYEEARRSMPAGRRPTVFFGSSWRGEWSVPSGNSYMARLITDAGGDYLFADRESDGNLTLGLETVMQQGARAGHWGRILAQATPVTAADIAGGDARIEALPAFTQRRCFYGNSMESDLFGAALLEPDVMLMDLAAILHPERVRGRTAVYLKPLQ